MCMAVVNEGVLKYMDKKKFLKILLIQNGLSDFEMNSQIFIEWPFSKCVWEILIHQETWVFWMGVLALDRHKEIIKNSSSVWNHWSDFKIIPLKCTFGDPFQTLFAKLWSFKKHGFGPLKNSGEQSRYILALLLTYPSPIERKFSLCFVVYYKLVDDRLNLVIIIVSIVEKEKIMVTCSIWKMALNKLSSKTIVGIDMTEIFVIHSCS